MIILFFSSLFIVEDKNFEDVNTAWLAELDGDTLIDIVMGKDVGTCIYYGRESYLTPHFINNENTVALCVKDMNHDKKPDIVISTETEIKLYMNNGNSFIEYLLFSYSADMICCADIDLDKKPDLIISSSSGVRIYKNNEIPEFSLLKELSPARSCLTLDINNDKYCDLITGGAGGVTIYTNTGGNDFVKFYELSGYDVYGIAEIDLNHDSLVDLVIADYGGNSFTLLNEGEVFIMSDTFFEPGAIGVCSRDFDMDGEEDVIFIKKNYADVVYLKKGNVWEKEEITVEPTNTFLCLTFDFDNDADMDVLSIGDESFLYKNTTNPSVFVKIMLEGRGEEFSDVEATGGKIYLKKEDVLAFYKEVPSAEGYRCGSVGQFIFENPTDSKLFINWPQTGIRDTLVIKGMSRYSYILNEDILPPLLPESIWCITHKVDEWSNMRVMQFKWQNAEDPYGSGVMGYSLLVDSFAEREPDSLVEVFYPDTNYVFKTDFEGTHYLHFRTVDSVGNLSEIRNLGKFKIDFSPPLEFELIEPQDSMITNRRTINFLWETSRDSISGIKWYRIQIAKDEYFSSLIVDTCTQDTSLSMLYIAEPGKYYWQVFAVDSAGNTISAGPRCFIVDTIPPQIKFTNPSLGEEDVSPDSPVWIKFTKEMDTTTFKEGIIFRGETTGEHDFEFTVLDKGWYEFKMMTPFVSFEKVFCTLKGTLMDIAGNGLDGNANGVSEGSPADDYDFYFKTGNLDTLGPLIREVFITPNPSPSRARIELKVIASDVDRGNSTVTHLFYFIDDTLTADTLWCFLEDGVPDSPTEIFKDSLSLDLDTGLHFIFLKARDLPGNWGPFAIETLYVSAINICLTIDKDTVEIGDSVMIEVLTTEKTKKCIIEFVKDKNMLQSYQIFSKDSLLFKDKIPIKAIMPGTVVLRAKVETISGQIAYAEKNIYIKESNQIIDPAYTFAYPNPCHKNINIKVFLRENAIVTIRILNLDGYVLYERKNIKIKGGEEHIESFDVEGIPFGIYLYSIVAEGEFTRRKAKYVDKFAVVK